MLCQQCRGYLITLQKLVAVVNVPVFHKRTGTYYTGKKWLMIRKKLCVLFLYLPYPVSVIKELFLPLFQQNTLRHGFKCPERYCDHLRPFNGG
jgi:hypothetical protein